MCFRKRFGLFATLPKASKPLRSYRSLEFFVKVSATARKFDNAIKVPIVDNYKLYLYNILSNCWQLTVITF